MFILSGSLSVIKNGVQDNLVLVSFDLILMYRINWRIFFLVISLTRGGLIEKATDRSCKKKNKKICVTCSDKLLCTRVSRFLINNIGRATSVEK